VTDMGSRFVLVTGATGGVGRAVCEQLSALGILPVIAFHSNDELAHEIALKTGGFPIKLDLSDDLSIDALVDGLCQLRGRLIGIAHCASPSPHISKVEKISPEEMLSFWRQNVVGPHRLLAGLVDRLFKVSKVGKIVAVTSFGMGAPEGGAMPNLGAYTISKYGLCGVLALFSAEYRWLEIHTVSPGFTDTPMLEVFDQRFIEILRSEGKLSSPDKIAQQILHYFLTDIQ